MKVKILTRSRNLSGYGAESITFYFGLFSDNIILNIKDTNKMTPSEKEMLDFIEENEEVNSFSYENKTLFI